MKLKEVSFVTCFISFYISSSCQFEPLIKNILLADTFNWNHSREKIYIHYDRPYYNINDTLWLKGYIVSARDGVAADSSKLVYIEVINSSGELIKRVSTYCSSGIFFSNIGLDKTDFKQGTYLLRAYTNYMRNYGDSLFFESSFKIIDLASLEWNLSVHDISLSNNRFILNAAIQPVSNQSGQEENVSVTLRSKNKILLKQKTGPGRNGNISIDTVIEKETTADTLQLEISSGDHSQIQLPVYPNKEKKIDLQFLPEGGSFIANKFQRLGFKAVNIFGKGIDVKGKIENSEKQLIAAFSSVHKGMGVVWLKPEMNERYIAVLDNGLSFELPLPKESGTQLQVTNQPESDSVEVMVDASPDLYNREYFFRASANGISCAVGIIRVKDKPYRLLISKKAFPSGICRFTLYDGRYLPVNERIILIWHHDNLILHLDAQKPSYDHRDSVHLLLTATNSNDQPIIGSFSLAVIDTGKVHYPAHAENIINYLLLSSDIKGNIEDPSYYFDSPLPEATEALMLTQGWVQYDRFFSILSFSYEKEFVVSGKVSNLVTKPIAKTNLTLFAKDGRSKTFVVTAKTDENGRFTFNNFPPFGTDSVSMVIQALNKRSKQFGVGVDVDLQNFPAYHSSVKPVLDQNIAYDTLAIQYAHQQADLYSRLKKEKGYLPEVIVTTKVKIRGSKNLNEDGGSDQVITPKILETMPKTNLIDILSKEITGFHKGVLGKVPFQLYKINGDIVVFIIDGYNINQVYVPVTETLDEFAQYEERYLRYINAEDVAGIEVMNSEKHSVAYEKYFRMINTALMKYSFIEITTYSGNGAFDKKVPGMYIYKPLAPLVAKTFYSPRYSVSVNDTTLPDYRSTVYWRPDIITNEKGQAELSFYTSDSNGGYLVVVQGTDMNGGFGAAYLPILIKKEERTTIK